MKLTSVCGVVQIHANMTVPSVVLQKKCLVLLCVRHKLIHAETRNDHVLFP